MIVKTFTVGYLSTNCYLVYNEGSNFAILIDCAGKGYKKISAFCEENNLKINAVLLTHGHFDHIGDALKWQQDGAKIYVHEGDSDKLYTDGNLGFQIGLIIPETHADIILHGNESLEINGLNIKVIHTPGHSKGSTTFVIENCMFAGDTLFEESFGRTDFYDGSLLQLSNSIKKLFDINGDYIVYPGHGEATTLNHERGVNPILNYLWRD